MREFITCMSICVYFDGIAGEVICHINTITNSGVRGAQEEE